MYTKDLVDKYVKNRGDYKETDQHLFEPLAFIGLIGKNVLDFGCGDGRYAKDLMAMGADSVSGIDISPDMIDLAKQNEIPGLSFFVADGAKLPFEENSFDIVFSNFVMHYFANVNLPISEICRVLKPGGYFIATYNTVLTKVGFEHLYNTEMPIKLGKSDNIVIVNNLIKSKDEFDSALADNKLRIIKEKILDHPSATIHDSYPHKDKIEKIVILTIAQKA
jgi:ubiquinone/menaquinone biosynthesis C-methylase UbiE